MDKYIDFRKKENLRPVSIPNKEKFYYDLENIEHSWSGRVDVMSLGNTFIMEAEQQLINALEIFELGYFDCAYYSLRSAVDVSTTIVFLADMPEADRETYLSKWKLTEDFPMHGQMLKKLSATSAPGKCQTVTSGNPSHSCSHPSKNVRPKQFPRESEIFVAFSQKTMV